VGSGVLLLVRPSWIHDHIPKLFPFLGHFKLERKYNALNLILMGLFLLLVGLLMRSQNYWGYFLALVISAWEVYLSVAFYHLKQRDIPQAFIHFVIHMIFVFLVGYFILNNFSQ